MFSDILENTFLGNTVLDYVICLGIALGGFIVLKIVQFFLTKYLKVWSAKTKTSADDFVINAIQKTILPLLYFGVIYLGINTLELQESFKNVLDILLMAIITISVARLAIALITQAFSVYQRRRENVALEKSLHGILKVAEIIIWGLALTVFLDNLGFKISAVLAGLGIGGVAVALAAQAVLKDLFSYFAILFDRPFEIGDFIITDEYLGVIEHIGIKTTRIRSLGGEQLIFSNTDLTSTRLRNYKRMEQRRISFKLGVTYQTPGEKLKKIPGMIEQIIRGIKDTTFDRSHFSSYGDFSLNFEIVYYILGADYNKYMDIQQDINFAIKEAFEKENIEFAYPTQTLFLNKE